MLYIHNIYFNYVLKHIMLFLSRRLLRFPTTTLPVDIVALYAFISSSAPASVADHILKFDIVITNVENAYH